MSTFFLTDTFILVLTYLLLVKLTNPFNYKTPLDITFPYFSPITKPIKKAFEINISPGAYFYYFFWMY